MLGSSKRCLSCWKRCLSCWKRCLGTGRGVEAYFVQASRLEIIDLAMALKKSQQVRHNPVPPWRAMASKKSQQMRHNPVPTWSGLVGDREPCSDVKTGRDSLSPRIDATSFHRRRMKRKAQRLVASSSEDEEDAWQAPAYPQHWSAVASSGCLNSTRKRENL